MFLRLCKRHRTLNFGPHQDLDKVHLQSIYLKCFSLREILGRSSWDSNCVDVRNSLKATTFFLCEKRVSGLNSAKTHFFQKSSWKCEKNCFFATNVLVLDHSSSREWAWLFESHKMSHLACENGQKGSCKIANPDTSSGNHFMKNVSTQWESPVPGFPVPGNGKCVDTF